MQLGAQRHLLPSPYSNYTSGQRPIDLTPAMLSALRSFSMVRVRDCLGRPGGRLQ